MNVLTYCKICCLRSTIRDVFIFFFVCLFLVVVFFPLFGRVPGMRSLLTLPMSRLERELQSYGQLFQDCFFCFFFFFKSW